MREDLAIRLSKYIPSSACELCAELLIQNEVELKVSRPRKTKLGDYRAPFKGKGHRISINGDLNAYSFLITLIHELAHLYAHRIYGRSIKPHGTEWKSYFQQLMGPFVAKALFPPEVENALESYLENPAASSCTDEQLYSVLKSYDTQRNDGYHFLEKIEPGSRFIYNKRLFRMERKLRKRYRCTEIASGRGYYFSALAEVKPVHD